MTPAGLHPVVLREPPDAAGELHHPRPQADGESAVSAGERGQDPVVHGPRHQLLPRGQGHRPDHPGGVRPRRVEGLSTHETWFNVCFRLRPTGRLDEYLACIAKIQKAVEYFQDNNPDSPELNTVVQYSSVSHTHSECTLLSYCWESRDG